jgi:hypothetical protein
MPSAVRRGRRASSRHGIEWGKGAWSKLDAQERGESWERERDAGGRFASSLKLRLDEQLGWFDRHGAHHHNDVEAGRQRLIERVRG